MIDLIDTMPEKLIDRHFIEDMANEMMAILHKEIYGFCRVSFIMIVFILSVTPTAFPSPRTLQRYPSHFPHIRSPSHYMRKTVGNSPRVIETLVE
jgi:hypothetical protein